jgi:hypothetical protein
MIAKIAIAAAAMLLAQVLIVAVLAAVQRHVSIYMTIIGVSIATAPVVFILGRFLVGQNLSIMARIYLMLVDLALGGFLFHFMTLPDRSVTLRILVELLVAPSQTLTVDALKHRYSVRSMIESRLVQLSAGAFIDISPERVITLKEKGVWFGRFVTGGRRLFRITSAN